MAGSSVGWKKISKGPLKGQKLFIGKTLSMSYAGVSAKNWKQGQQQLMLELESGSASMDLKTAVMNQQPEAQIKPQPSNWFQAMTESGTSKPVMANSSAMLAAIQKLQQDDELLGAAPQATTTKALNGPSWDATKAKLDAANAKTKADAEAKIKGYTPVAAPSDTTDDVGYREAMSLALDRALELSELIEDSHPELYEDVNQLMNRYNVTPTSTSGVWGKKNQAEVKKILTGMASFLTDANALIEQLRGAYLGASPAQQSIQAQIAAGQSMFDFDAPAPSIGFNEAAEQAMVAVQNGTQSWTKKPSITSEQFKRFYKRREATQAAATKMAKGGVSFKNDLDTLFAQGGWAVAGTASGGRLRLVQGDSNELLLKDPVAKNYAMVALNYGEFARNY